mmetsp:Transcript_45726/g.95965  ORF Transcript_45726/g.95965 Transcript_45726/m.95965 type:complete len:314 (+) Transcript_45726:125-1066(+)|eukprot:CAMPEP_0183710116 /NCGR_PEP_ID=MMETSP0737-20130205/5955_1 /TAXON_ID=385413 /ORGANISM="Thalassiosira miniscula, Strain CCMP1093" /LENGTH=313 /DNA_ID=CAMNT_0025938339 /DNA_START=73 /DNA_END=1014 /DNA_ORIENTATION=+
MKVFSTAAVALLAGASSTTAFAPSASKAALSTRTSCSGNTCLNMNLPFFAQEQETKDEEPAAEAPAATSDALSTAAVDVVAEAQKDAAKAKAEMAELDAMSMEDEVEMLVQKELNKTKRMSNLRNEKGVEYAPWMGISEAEENKIRSLMRDRTEARRKRQEQERDVSGNLFRDSQAQELSGTGLSYKIIDGEVELQWATRSEMDTKGFIVKRRAAKTNDYSVIASYEDWGPLASKGKEGGVYRFLDSTVSPGGWVYRISEEDNGGNQADVCQCLVEVETEDEQRAAVIAGVGFAVFAVLAVVAGVAIDPMNGY